MNFPDFPEIEENQPEAPVSFHFEDLRFDLPSPEAVAVWLTAVAESEGKKIRELAYIFCSDDYLLRINREHLRHDYFTDVITFQYSENDIHGDVFISADRVRENAATNGVSFFHELSRVMVHGLLHLAGHSDKTPAQRAEMTRLENFYLEKM